MHANISEDDVRSNTQSEHKERKWTDEYLHSNFITLIVFSMSTLRTNINSKVVHSCRPLIECNFTKSE